MHCMRFEEPWPGHYVCQSRQKWALCLHVLAQASELCNLPILGPYHWHKFCDCLMSYSSCDDNVYMYTTTAAFFCLRFLMKLYNNLIIIRFINTVYSTVMHC